MAKVKLEANTQDAQKKIQKLRQEIDKLDKQVKSPKKYNLQTKGLGVGSMAGGLGLGGRAMGMTVAAGSAIGGLAATALTKLVNVLGSAIPALLKFGLGIDNVNGLMEKWSHALESYSNAPQKALERAMQLDSLDDERRAHGTKTVGEEVAWFEAYKSIAGNDFNSMLLTKFETLLEQVKSGDVNAIETVKQFDTMTGYTATGPRGEMEEEWAIANHLNKMNTYEFMTEMLKGYNAALAKGDYSKTDAMLKLVGNRGISAIRKLGDLSTLEKDKADIQKQWESVLPQDLEERMLKYASMAEKEAALSKVYEIAIPESGMSQNYGQNGDKKTGDNYILDGAAMDRDKKELSYNALAGTNTEIRDSVIKEAEQDFNKLKEQVINSDFGKYINEKVVDPLKTQFDTLKDTVKKTQEDIAKIAGMIPEPKDTMKTASKAVGTGFKVASFINPAMPLPPAQLFTNVIPAMIDGKFKFNGESKDGKSSFNPAYYAGRAAVGLMNTTSLINPSMMLPTRLLDASLPHLLNKKNDEPKKTDKKDEETKKQNQEVVTALKEVTTSLKTNANATNQMNQTMQKGLVVNGSTTGNSPAVFA